jgi:DNA-binding transcriptional MerR regulator
MVHVEVRFKSMLSITEVGEATGLASSALRFYERNGLIEPTGRAGGKRVYDDDVVWRLALVDIYQQAGFTIGEIGTLLDAEGPETWRTMAKAKLVELEEKIRFASEAKALLEHTLQCPDPTITGCAKFRKSITVHAGHLRSRVHPLRPDDAEDRPAGPGGRRRRPS